MADTDWGATESVEWMRSRICSAETQITAIESALSALATTGVQQYSLDTGQTRQTVTRANITELRNTLAFWNSERERWTNKLYGVTAHNARPAWG